MAGVGFEDLKTCQLFFLDLFTPNIFLFLLRSALSYNVGSFVFILLTQHKFYIKQGCELKFSHYCVTFLSTILFAIVKRDDDLFLWGLRLFMPMATLHLCKTCVKPKSKWEANEYWIVFEILSILLSAFLSNKLLNSVQNSFGSAVAGFLFILLFWCPDIRFDLSFYASENYKPHSVDWIYWSLACVLALYQAVYARQLNVALVFGLVMMLEFFPDYYFNFNIKLLVNKLKNGFGRQTSRPEFNRRPRANLGTH